MKKVCLISKTLLISLLCFICVCVAGCLTTADYEAIYNDDTKIITCSSNTQSVSAETTLGNEYSWSCSSFSGVYQLKTEKIDTSSQVNLSLKVEKGKIKIVVISGQTVYVLAEGNYDGVLDFTDIPSGSYTLKAVGVEAGFSLKLS